MSGTTALTPLELPRREAADAAWNLSRPGLSLGHRLSLTHVADAEWRAAFVGHPLFAPVGYGVAATPWRAVQRTAWDVVKAS